MTEIHKLIIDHIDVWTSAIKKKSASGRGSSNKTELAGIKKLRELILELAVRGKLVPQDPNDEPASVLLEKIDAEKTQLIADKKIRKQNKSATITDIEKPFTIPNGWSVNRLIELSILENGDRSKNYPNKSLLVEQGIPFVNAGHLTNGTVNQKEMTFITEERFELLRGGKFRPGDILYCLRGSLGKSALVQDIVTGAIASSLVIIRTYSDIAHRYLMYYFDSPFAYNLIKKYDNGTAQPNLSATDLAKFVVPLPPLAEQHRIVAKVDELMALCDQLEQQTEQSLTAHQTLVEELLKALIEDASGKTTMDGGNVENAGAIFDRIAEHFDILFTTEHSIEQLKQTILQLAVMGKLVPQNPNDEPASVLLEKIAEEKAQLIKEKKIKKQKPLPAITDEEKPFELPRGWSYTRLDDLCANVSSGSTPPKSELSESGDIPFLKVYNIQNQEIEFKERTLFVTKDAHMSKLNRSILFPGDVIMNLVGPPLGKVAIMPSTYPEWNCNQNIVCFRPLELELNKYIYTYLKSHLFLNYIILVGSAGQDFISGTKCRAIALPIPPLSEQHRIVAKVDELMALCDQLKARLNDAKTTQLHLADAVVENAL